MDSIWDFFGGLCVGVVLVVLIATYTGTATDERERAVEEGVAEYYLNDDNEKKFRYLECE